MPLVGDGARLLVNRALAVRGRDPDEAVYDAFQRAYVERPCVHTTLLPGAREALALGIPCALVTNKPRAVAMLVVEHLGIAGAFQATWAGGDGPLKPAPDGVIATAERLGISVQDAWMIGDGPQDILAGKAAGAFTVGVRGGIAEDARLREAKPDLLVESLHALVTSASARSP